MNADDTTTTDIERAAAMAELAAVAIDPAARSLARPPSAASLRTLVEEATALAATMEAGSQRVARETRKLADSGYRGEIVSERIAELRGEILAKLAPRRERLEPLLRAAAATSPAEVRTRFLREAAAAEPQRSSWWSTRFSGAPGSTLPGHADDAVAAADDVRIQILIETVNGREAELGVNAFKAARAVLDAYVPAACVAAAEKLAMAEVLRRRIAIAWALIAHERAPSPVETIALGLAQAQADRARHAGAAGATRA